MEGPEDQMNDYAISERRPYYTKIVIENLPYTYTYETAEGLVKDCEGFVKGYGLGKNYYAFFSSNDDARKCIETINDTVIDFHELKVTYAKNMKTQRRNGLSFDKHFDESYDVNLISYQSVPKRFMEQNYERQDNYYNRQYPNQMDGSGMGYDNPNMPNDGVVNHPMPSNNGYYNRAPMNRFYNMNNGSGNANETRPFNNQGPMQSGGYSVNGGMHDLPQNNNHYTHNQFQRNYDPQRQNNIRFSSGGRVRGYENRDPGMGGYRYPPQNNNPNSGYQTDQPMNPGISPMDYGSQQRTDRAMHQQKP